jgi:hypothetical protein
MRSRSCLRGQRLPRGLYLSTWGHLRNRLSVQHAARVAACCG